MKQLLVGREEEIEILKDALQPRRADMVAVIGRRRVGKTFLIKSVYKEHIAYEVTGIQHENRLGQLQNFMSQIYKLTFRTQKVMKIPKKVYSYAKSGTACCFESILGL